MKDICTYMFLARETADEVHGNCETEVTYHHSSGQSTCMHSHQIGLIYHLSITT